MRMKAKKKAPPTQKLKCLQVSLTLKNVLNYLLGFNNGQCGKRCLNVHSNYALQWVETDGEGTGGVMTTFTQWKSQDCAVPKRNAAFTTCKSKAVWRKPLLFPTGLRLCCGERFGIGPPVRRDYLPPRLYKPVSEVALFSSSCLSECFWPIILCETPSAPVKFTIKVRLFGQ